MRKDSDEFIQIKKSQLEEIVEQKVENKVEQKTDTEESKTEKQEISRRSFLKKLGAGTIGLGALSLAPAASQLKLTKNGIETDGGTDYVTKVITQDQTVLLEDMETNASAGTVPTAQSNGTVQMQTVGLEASSEPSSPSTGEVWVPDQETTLRSGGSKGWTYSGHSGNITAVSADLKGEYVYSTSGYYNGSEWTGEVHQINVSDGSQGWTYTGHSGRIYGVAAGIYGDYVYSGGGGNYEVHQINVSDGSQGWTYTGHSSYINSISPGVNGQYLYSTDDNSEVHQINVSDGSQGWTYTGHSDYVLAVAVGPSGEYIFSAGRDNEVHKIDAKNGSQEWVYTGHSDYIRAIDVDSKGKFVYSGGDDTEVHQINAIDGNQGWVYNFGSGEEVDSVVAGVEENKVYAGNNEGVGLIQLNAKDGSLGWSNSNQLTNNLATGPNDYIYVGNASDNNVVQYEVEKKAKRSEVYHWNGSNWV